MKKPPPPPEEESKAQALALGIVFFLSGMAALLYEAAWQRQFTLLFGSAAPATAAVLAAYFAGLGLGSWLLGKWGARWSRPLRTYAVLELVTAAGALLVTPLLSLYARFYPDIFSLGQNSPALLVAAKGLLAFLAIVIPSAAMGGTLPVLAQLFENRRDRLGDLAGRLYMLNTAGAALGVLLFPLLLGMLGLRASVWSCVLGNVALAGAAFILAKSTAPPAPPARPPKKIKPDAPGLRRWLALAFASGFITFVLQIGWSRLFAQTHENSVHSFSVIVAVFIAAIAAGAQLARILLRRKWRPENALHHMWITGSLLTMLAAELFPVLTGGMHYKSGTAMLQWSLLGPALLVIFIPVLFLATGLPFLLQKTAAVTRQPAGALTGTVLAWNIAGSVAGALSAGFLFPSIFGMWGTLYAAALTAMVCAILIFPQRAAACTAFAAAGLIPGIATHFGKSPRGTSVPGEVPLAKKEGTYGVAVVVEHFRPGPLSRELKLNNQYGLGGTASTADERMQAHLPLLLHPAPRRVAFLGYGTGISAGGALYHAPEEVIALELVPDVALLAGDFFAEANNEFASQPNARVVIEDARNFLRGTPQQFDVIVGDLVVPWRQGEGALYTLEHFQTARTRLTPGGLYCAWLPVYQLNEDDFHCLLRTFLQVFPNTSVWRGDFDPLRPALALIGFSGAGFDIAPATLTARIAAMPKPDPLNTHLARATAVWMYYIGTLSSAQTRDVPLNTEDRPLIELRTTHSPPFTGRKFQAWADDIRRASPTPQLPPDAAAGREAGRLMAETTLLFSEGRKTEAADAQREVFKTLDPETARAVFPP